MATIVYLDVDDEITSAAARIRGAGERRLAIVLPAGSRVSTSRINFRLLAREAASRGRELSIVAPEAGTRSLAASAGLPAFMSVVEYEDALADIGADESSTGQWATSVSPAATSADVAPVASGVRSTGVARPGGGPHGVAGATAVGLTGAAPGPATGTPGGAVARVPAGSAAGPSSGGPVGPATSVRARSATRDTVTLALPAVEESRPSRRRFSGLLLAVASILIVAVLASATAAWQLLPTAVITVHPRVEPVGPLAFTVRADPLEVTPDAAAGVIPAEVVTFDLAVSQDFPATGRKITETAATGDVRWTNCDPTRAYTVPVATVVRTPDGDKFTTSDAVFLPVAILSGNPPQITCQSRDVGVTATDPGTDGNVDRGQITVVPSTYNSVVIRVTNPAATTGGSHTETKIVAQKDVDAAMTTLTKALRDEFASQLADPSHTPAGLTLFPATKSASSGEPTVDPNSLVGQATPTFTLGMTGTGTATAVDPSLVKEIGVARARAAVSPDRSLVADSINVQLGTPHVDGSAVLYPVTAQAGQVQRLDASALRTMVKGLSVDDAQDRLRDYGDATVDVWPAWVSSITSYDFRLDVHVESDVTVDQGQVSPSAAASPGTSPSPRSVSPRPGTGPASSPSPSGT